ncbi:class I SAM-dependent methyltransferase [Bacillus sp. FSL W7-1360]
MSYTYFPAWYDRLMSHVPYDDWLRLVEKVVEEQSGRRMKTILDVGCGTGALLLLMHEKGWQPVGVDLSPEMLSIAHDKLIRSGYKPQLYEANMSLLPALGHFDVITVFCDSLNYLPDEDAVKQAFARFFASLQPGGVLLFDVHSPEKMRKFPGLTFADASEDVSYIWQSFSDEGPLSVVHELTFFVQDETGMYVRFEEVHEERTFLVSQYEQWLYETGFSEVVVTADFTEAAPTEHSERLFFKCIKK